MMATIVRGLLRIKDKSPSYRDFDLSLEGFEFKLSQLNKQDTAIVYPIAENGDKEFLHHFFHSYRSYFDPEGNSIIITVEKGFYPDFWIDIFKEEG